MIIGFSGKMQAGKDTCGHYLELSRGYSRVSFAEYLKKLASLAGWTGRKDDQGRKFLQEFGMLVQENDQMFWVNKAFDKMKRMSRQGKTDFAFTDVRFPHEANAIRELGGIIIRIDLVPGDSRLKGVPKKLLEHVSEVSMDDYPYFYGRIESAKGNFNSLYDQLEGLIEAWRASGPAGVA